MSNSILTDKKTGEKYLGGFAEYYLAQQALYKNYAEFEQAQVKQYLETVSDSVRANFSNLWQN